MDEQALNKCADRISRSAHRADDQLREVRMDVGVSKYAEGSCLMEMGETRVLCTASVENGVPVFLRGTEQGWITAEYGMLPRACSERTPRDASRGKISGRTMEIQRLIGRSLRAVVDLSALGERTIWIDCDVLQGDGGTRCAAITGGFVALALSLRHLQRQGHLSKSPLGDHVAAVSIGVLGGRVLLDLDYAEDSTADVDCNLVMTGGEKLVELQSTGERRTFSREELGSLLAVGWTGILQLIHMQRKVLEGIL